MSFLKKIFGKKEKDKKLPTPDQTTEIEKSFEEIKYLIYPYFKQLIPSTSSAKPLPNDLSGIDKDTTYEVPDLDIIILNICEDLNCLYAVDNGNSYQIIQNSHLKEWKIDKEKLHEIAVTNFRTLIVTKLNARGDSNGIMFTINGNLEAGLVLIDEIWDQLEQQIGEPVVISVPSRDVLVATGKSNTIMINSPSPGRCPHRTFNELILS
jgi:hypothetical protein